MSDLDFTLDFTGKTVLLIGGSSGIGNGIAHAFRLKGADVHVTGTKADASDYAGVSGSDLTGLHYSKLDITKQDEIDAWTPAFGKLDVLIQCQGSVLYNQQEFKMDGFRFVTEVNQMSVMAVALKFHPMLKATQGNMIIVSSDAAFHTTRGNPAYHASKKAAVGLTQVLAEAWARDKIRINGIAPGLVPTKLTAVSTDHPERMEKYIQRIPMRRAGTPADMAGVALFLASPLSAYVLGQIIQVDGGMLLA